MMQQYLTFNLKISQPGHHFVTPFAVEHWTMCLILYIYRGTHPYPLSLVLNSTKAGEVETLWGLKVRGDVMDTKLIIWWIGIAEPIEDASWVADSNKLKARFSVFVADAGASACEFRPNSLKNTKLHELLDHICILMTIWNNMKELYAKNEIRISFKQNAPCEKESSSDWLVSFFNFLDIFSPKHIRGCPKHKNFLRMKVKPISVAVGGQIYK